ncbi:hypothetical protein OB2597_08799 [Pseudooceanicola batsensis HTCC2597]|uniref:Tyrosine specific protein phosphatases domain-containing protein n=1 Tax=Pseudooceanicola batsensis (strain ATCC BAA-863 / DSM 15984 / KCTC 12145 / HTCC2597) TaxID=252305 RepID=A3TUN2_PSEBH|nr:tyrosine-protein phosphatase [Pseudooceanicola batsensis]EAQ04228.1 hypothetical protein OB2597_08799 [Pseudooceanicola batsensis HTCC2597]
MKLIARLQAWERAFRKSFNVDLSTPENRRRARTYNLYFDHAVLRTVWGNFFQISPDVYRSNHPTHARLARMKARGITTVLNLRGTESGAPYLTERVSCGELGLTMVDCNLIARAAAPKEDILNLIDCFRRIEKPFVMHCKSGADRAGFASAIYLMVIEGEPVERARRMLSPRYIHFRWTRTGILDHILDHYAARNAASEIGFEDWIRTEYDPQAMQLSFDQSRGKA